MRDATSTDQHRVAVIWPRFGPYHLARLEAAGELLSGKGMLLYGLEVAGRDPEYAWDLTEGSRRFERLTLFDDGDYAALTSREIHAAVWRVLERLRPSGVAIPGWSFAEARAALRWCAERHAVAILMSESKRDDFARLPHREFLKSQMVGSFDAALVGGSPHAEYAAAMGVPPGCVFQGYDVVDNEHFRRGAEEARSRAAEWRQRLDLPERFFLTCCRFVPKKNVSRLLEAYALYRTAAAEPWRLVICGDGPLGPNLRARADALGLSDVRWPGFLQVDEITKHYGLASAFVLTSTQDQWGLVVNEAMASGVPVLVSRAAGCRYDLVDEGRNGCLLDPLDPVQMADRMLRVSRLSDEERGRMGEASAAIIAEWGPARFAEGLWNAFEAARSQEDREPALLRRVLLSVFTHPLLCPRKHRR